MKIRFTLICCLLFTILSCHKEEVPSYNDGGGGDTTSSLNTEKELLSFTLTDSLNKTYLARTITARIDDSVITLALPSQIDISHLIASFDYKGKSVFVGDTRQKSGQTVNDFSKDLIYVVMAEDSSRRKYVVNVDRTSREQSVLPHIYIQVDHDGEITSKDDYVHADIRIDGKGEFADYEGRTKIRGRGNTSWGWPKKPYKLKLIDKAPLFGLAAYKKWILLANYNDRTLLMNAIPYRLGYLLGMPYTNDIIPVELTLNGKDQGFYVFTEHKEVGPGRIDIGKGDQAGVLLELDSYFDEPYEFKSKQFQLPVMIKYPKLDKWKNQQAINTRFDEIQSRFEDFEALIADPAFPHNNYLDYFNDTSYVDYLLIYLLTDNEEINHPKSTYINKSEGEQKYKMGIIWDFDWGFGFQQQSTHYDLSTADDPLFWEWSKEPGAKFFPKFLADPTIRALLKERWVDFKDNDYDGLKEYIKHYAELIRPVYDKDHDLWGVKNALGKKDSSGDLDTDLQKVLDWLDARVTYVDGYINGL